MALKETIQEFKEFAIKGNVVDMAVGVIIGGAFGKIVTSYVNDLIMPIIGKLTGGADFSQLYLPLDGNHYATLADAQAATATIAYDHIDTAYSPAHDILWRNAPGCNADSVAQYIASLLLIHEETKRDPLAGKTIGVVGAGNVGSRVAKVAETLGMRVLLNDPPRERKEGISDFVSLEQIQEEADFITFHVPLLRDGSDRTFHLADAPFFAGLKRTPFLINSSRGEVTDNEALKSALRSGGIRGAALDVWEQEPGIDLELMNLLEFATPHIAGYSADGKANGTAACVRTVAEFFGLEDAHGWYPEIPVPATTHLRVHSLAEAVASAYDVRQDDARLRRSPETFEKQRGNYPLRREFPAFTIDRTSPLKEEQFEILRKLGFQIR